MSNSVYVLRDGHDVSGPLGGEDAAFAWLLNHQSASVHHALRHEGYAIVNAEGLPLDHEYRS